MTEYTESVLFSTFGCGACIDLEYCASFGADISDEWIGNFELNTLTNATPDQPASGYTDFTGSGITTTLETYATYSLALEPTYAGQLYNEYFMIYIDYNQNGVFDAPAEIAFDGGGFTQMAITGSITVPATAIPGLTRMRVVMRFNNTPQPCENTVMERQKIIVSVSLKVLQFVMLLVRLLQVLLQKLRYTRLGSRWISWLLHYKL